MARRRIARKGRERGAAAAAAGEWGGGEDGGVSSCRTSFTNLSGNNLTPSSRY